MSSPTTARHAEHAAPHVVLLSANAGSHSRVRSMGRSLGHCGALVTVLGPSRSEQRSITINGAVRTMLVPLVQEVQIAIAGIRARSLRRRVLTAATTTAKDRLILARQLRLVWEQRVDTAISRGIVARRGMHERAPGIASVASLLFALPILALRASVRLLKALDDLGVAILKNQDVVQRRVRRARFPSLLGPIRWRRLFPQVADYELTFGKVLDDLAPDVIHAFGFECLAVAEAAVARAAAKGREVRLAYEPLVDLSVDPMESSAHRAAAVRIEASGISRAELVTTTDPQVAANLQRMHGLARPPVTLKPLPPFAGPTEPEEHDLRRDLTLVGEQELLVFGQPCRAEDGAEHLVELLASLAQSVHLALFFDASEPRALKSAVRRSRDLGCRERLHLVPRRAGGLPHGYLRRATLGVLPRGLPVGRIPQALAEHIHAGLPTIAPAGTQAAEIVDEFGVGLTYEPNDAAHLHDAVEKALAQPASFTDLSKNAEALLQFSWESQEPSLLEAYRVALRLRFRRGQEWNDTESVATEGWGFAEPGNPDATIKGTFGIGPRNGNGMAWEWSKALRRVYPQIDVQVFSVQYHTGKLDMTFPCHHSVPLAQWKSLDWQLAWARYVLENFSHLLIEQALSVCGTLNGRRFYHDLPMLTAHGISVGLVFRGSEIRDPRKHAEREPYSPFRDPDDPLTQRLQQQVDAMRPHIDAFDGRTFVTTLDLKDDLPEAHWLPHVIDIDRWAGDGPILQRAVPVVVHAPSREKMKGSSHVDDVCIPLAEAGKIEYRRLRGIPFEQMPGTLRGADVVIDQLALGSYGVLALQAMCAQRLVIGHVSERVRRRLPTDLPIVEATADTLEEVLHDLMADAETANGYAQRGLDYARRYHSGRYAAGQLARFLGIDDHYAWERRRDALGEVGVSRR